MYGSLIIASCDKSAFSNESLVGLQANPSRLSTGSTGWERWMGNPSKVRKYDKPISLAPLSLEDALRGVAATGPVTEDRSCQPEPTERKVTKTWGERKAASAKRARRKE
jgi:hypothetical protein